MSHAVTEGELSALVGVLSGRRVLVLTGAGISTESGIPDYRSPESLAKRSTPIQYREFVGSSEARRRYWARSSLGWPRIRDAVPNAGHDALAHLERTGAISGVLTQNVDGLHHKAGSVRVLELHGGLDRVVCLDCGAVESRNGHQSRLRDLNPRWADLAADSAPDGDSTIDGEIIEDFVVAPCRRCGGVLKPDIVFFGENVPSHRVDEAWRLLEEAEVLLVAGSSLTVYSGFRFARRASADRKPVAIVNRGPTRGDDLAHVRIDGATGDVLPRLAERLVACAGEV